MTYQELVTEVLQLAPNERWQLLELLLRSLRTEMVVPTPAASSLERVRGMLQPDGSLPGDEEFRDDYTRYLIEKYS